MSGSSSSSNFGSSADSDASPHQGREEIRINIEDKYMYCVARVGTSDEGATPIRIASASGTDSTSDPMKLYKGERKIIERMIMDHHLKGYRKGFAKSTVKVNNSSFIRPLTETYEERRASSDFSYLDFSRHRNSALVISWKGRGAPPEKLDFNTVAASHQDMHLKGSVVDRLPYKRIWNHGGDSTGSQLRFHWSEIVLFDRPQAFNDDANLEVFWKTLQRETNETEFTLSHVYFTIKPSELDLKKILLGFQWSTGSNLSDQNHWRDILHSIHKLTFGSDAKVVHGKTMYDELQQYAEDPQGLQRLAGQNHALYLDGLEDLVPTRQKRSKLFFPSISVADFMLKYSGGAEDVKTGSEQEILRGKLVEFKLDGSKIVKGIESVSPIAAINVADTQKHSVWRGKSNVTLRNPELPCINVGTKFRPALLPPELAVLVPGQTSKRIQDSAYQPQADELIRTSLAEGESDEGDELRRRLPNDLARTKFAIRKMELPSKQTHRSTIPELVKDNVDQSTRLIFVVPDTDIINTALWKTFESSLKQVLNTDINGQRAATHPIVLSYQPGEDPTKLWSAQLTKAKKNGEGAPLAVVALRNDQHHAFLYKTVKTLCEVDVGLQSVFLKVNTMEQKEDRCPGRGALMTAKVMAKKIALRNPPPVKALHTGDRIDISVAVHIGQFSIKAPKPKEDGSCTSGSEASKSLYVLTLSSRDTQKSQGYRTSTKLLGPEGIHEVPLAEHVKEFVDGLVTGAEKGIGHRITILRSGYVPMREDPKISTSSLRTLPEHKDKDEIWDAFGSKKPSAATIPNLKNKVINHEMAMLVNAVKTMLGEETSVSYLLLSDHQDFVLRDRHRQKIEAHSTNDEGAANSSYFAVDRGQERFGQGFLGSHRIIHVTNNNKVINLALLGDRLSREMPKKFTKYAIPQQSKPIYIEVPTPDSILRPSEESGGVEVGLPGRGPMQSDPSPPDDKVLVAAKQVVHHPFAVRRWLDDLAMNKDCVTEPELDQLAHLWYDERLELANTKWPVPTYLAQLATKRAQFHLTFDDFDGTSDTAPCKLRPVHDDVKDTLYFL